MDGHKTFSLALWKQCVEIMQDTPKITALKLAFKTGCTEKTAEAIITDYRKLFKGKKRELRKQKQTPETFNKIFLNKMRSVTFIVLHLLTK